MHLFKESPYAYAQRRANETRHAYIVAVYAGEPRGAAVDCALNRRAYREGWPATLTFKVFRPRKCQVQ